MKRPAGGLLDNLNIDNGVVFLAMTASSASEGVHPPRVTRRVVLTLDLDMDATAGKGCCDGGSSGERDEVKFRRCERARCD